MNPKTPPDKDELFRQIEKEQGPADQCPFTRSADILLNGPGADRGMIPVIRQAAEDLEQLRRTAYGEKDTGNAPGNETAGSSPGSPERR